MAQTLKFTPAADLVEPVRDLISSRPALSMRLRRSLPFFQRAFEVTGPAHELELLQKRVAALEAAAYAERQW